MRIILKVTPWRIKKQKLFEENKCRQIIIAENGKNGKGHQIKNSEFLCYLSSYYCDINFYFQYVCF
jgi:tRNA A22 N-methylase